MEIATFYPIAARKFCLVFYWLMAEFGHSPVAFQYSLIIVQRLSNSLWAFPSGFPIPFQQGPAAVQQPLRAFPSGYWLKPSNFRPFDPKMFRFCYTMNPKWSDCWATPKMLSSTHQKHDNTFSVTFQPMSQHQKNLAIFCSVRVPAGQSRTEHTDGAHKKRQHDTRQNYTNTWISWACSLT